MIFSCLGTSVLPMCTSFVISPFLFSVEQGLCISISPCTSLLLDLCFPYTFAFLTRPLVQIILLSITLRRTYIVPLSVTCGVRNGLSIPLSLINGPAPLPFLSSLLCLSLSLCLIPADGTCSVLTSSS